MVIIGTPMVTFGVDLKPRHIDNNIGMQNSIFSTHIFHILLIMNINIYQLIYFRDPTRLYGVPRYDHGRAHSQQPNSSSLLPVAGG